MFSDALQLDHDLQLQAFLRFAKFKRAQHIREVITTVDECEADNVHEGEVYSTGEVRKLLAGLRDELRKYVDKEVENAYHSSALLVKLLLLQAQQAGASLGVDTNQLENELMLKQIASSETMALSRPAADFAKKAGALGKLGSAPTAALQDPAIAKERDALRQEAETLRSRMATLQAATTSAMREKSELREALEAANAKLASLQAAHAGEVGALSQRVASLGTEASAAAGSGRALDEARAAAGDAVRQLSEARQRAGELQEQLRRKEAEAKAAQSALSDKVSDSKQWQQMKKLMQQKSQEVVALRKRLHRYEPAEVPTGDAAAEGQFEGEF